MSGEISNTMFESRPLQNKQKKIIQPEGDDDYLNDFDYDDDIRKDNNSATSHNLNDDDIIKHNDSQNGGDMSGKPLKYVSFQSSNNKMKHSSTLSHKDSKLQKEHLSYFTKIAEFRNRIFSKILLQNLRNWTPDEYQTYKVIFNSTNKVITATAYYDSKLFTGDIEGNLLVIDLNTSKTLGDFPKYREEKIGCMVCCNRMVEIGDSDGGLTFINPNTFQVVKQMNNVMPSMVNIIEMVNELEWAKFNREAHKKLQFVGDSIGCVKVINYAKFEIAHDFGQIFEQTIAQILLYKGSGLIVDKSGCIKALNTESFKTINNFKGEKPFFDKVQITSGEYPTCVVSNDKLFIGGCGGRLVCLDSENFEIIKDFGLFLDVKFNCMCIVDNELLFIGDHSGDLVCLSIQTLETIKHFTRFSSDRICVMTQWESNKLLIGSVNGHLISFNWKNLDVDNNYRKYVNNAIYSMNIIDEKPIIMDILGNIKILSATKFKLPINVESATNGSIEVLKKYRNRIYIGDQYGYLTVCNENNLDILNKGGVQGGIHMESAILSIKSHNNEILIFDLSGNIKVIHYASLKIIKDIERVIDDTALGVKFYNKETILILHHPSDITAINANTFQKIKTIKNLFQNGVQLFEISGKFGDMIYLGSSGKFQLKKFNMKTLEVEYDYGEYLEDAIWCLKKNPEKTHLYVGDASGNFKILCTETNKTLLEEKSFLDDRIINAKVYNDKLYVYDSKGNLKIIDNKNFEIIQFFKNFIKKQGENECSMEIYHNRMIIVQGKVLKILNLDTFETIYQDRQYTENIMSASLKLDDKFIVGTERGSLKIFYANHFSIDPYNVSMLSYLVPKPEGIGYVNIQCGLTQLSFSIYHLMELEYLNKLKQFIELYHDQYVNAYQTAKFINQVDIHVLIEAYSRSEQQAKFPELLDAIFSNKKVNSLELDFIDLYWHIKNRNIFNEYNSAHIMKIFGKNQFVKTDYVDYVLKGQCDNQNFVQNTEPIFKKAGGLNDGKSCKAIVYKFAGKMNFQQPEKKSIDYQKALSSNYCELEKVGIFSSCELHQFVEHLWYEAKHFYMIIFYWQMVMTMLHFAQAFLMENYQFANKIICIITIILSTPLLILEFYQIKEEKFSFHYFHSLGNSFDWLAIISYYTNSIFYLCSPGISTANLNVYCITCLFIFTRFYEITKVFNNLRKFTGAVFQIGYKIIPYMIIILFFGLTSSNQFYLSKFWHGREMTDERLEINYIWYFYWTFEIWAGNWDVGSPKELSLTTLSYILLILVQIVYNIIMFNALIAIVGMSFDDYLETQPPFDTYYKLEMLLEIYAFRGSIKSRTKRNPLDNLYTFTIFAKVSLEELDDSFQENHERDKIIHDITMCVKCIDRIQNYGVGAKTVVLKNQAVLKSIKDNAKMIETKVDSFDKKIMGIEDKVNVIYETIGELLNNERKTIPDEDY